MYSVSTGICFRNAPPVDCGVIGYFETYQEAVASLPPGAQRLAHTVGCNMFTVPACNAGSGDSRSLTHYGYTIIKEG